MPGRRRDIRGREVLLDQALDGGVPLGSSASTCLGEQACPRGGDVFGAFDGLLEVDRLAGHVVPAGEHDDPQRAAGEPFDMPSVDTASSVRSLAMRGWQLIQRPIFHDVFHVDLHRPPLRPTLRVKSLVDKLVHLLGRYLNRPEWLHDLRTTWSVVSAGDDQTDAPGLAGLTGSGQVPRRHAIVDRLPASDIESLISVYLAGATARGLAERYSISQTAVKALLRKRGVRRDRRSSEHS
ncbi:hypothetical protein BCD48_00210 [Pseudofrankia sp. BMG5.36]|nr:hypothetical protein BCD48_00210 [Pseudofrankia sp. BMG5.36]